MPKGFRKDGSKLGFQKEHTINVGKSSWNKNLTKETDERIRKMSIKTSQTRRKKQIPKQLWKNSEYREKLLTIFRSPKERENRSLRMKTLWQNQREQMLEAFQKRDNTKASERMTLLNLTQNPMKNEQIKRKAIANALIGLFKRPTSLEQEFIYFFKKYNLPFQYVGNGQFLIGYKNPDFIESNKRKICIEVANDFHHDQEWLKNRVLYFKKYGWECLALILERKKRRDRYIKDEIEMLQTIKKFIITI